MESPEVHILFGKSLKHVAEKKHEIPRVHWFRVAFGCLCTRTPDALSYHIAILQLVKERSDNAAQVLYREVTRLRLCPAWITGTAEGEVISHLHRQHVMNGIYSYWEHFLTLSPNRNPSLAMESTTFIDNFYIEIIKTSRWVPRFPRP